MRPPITTKFTWPVSRGVSAASFDATGRGVRTGQVCKWVKFTKTMEILQHKIKNINKYQDFNKATRSINSVT